MITLSNFDPALWPTRSGLQRVAVQTAKTSVKHAPISRTIHMATASRASKMSVEPSKHWKRKRRYRPDVSDDMLLIAILRGRKTRYQNPAKVDGGNIATIREYCYPAL